jgi:hypothetical protein
MSISLLRMKLQDPDSELFTDTELQTILDQYSTVSQSARVDLAWADCLEILISDIRKWTSYSVGGMSETFDKVTIAENIKRIRRRWNVIRGSEFKR